MVLIVFSFYTTSIQKFMGDKDISMMNPSDDDLERIKYHAGEMIFSGDGHCYLIIDPTLRDIKRYDLFFSHIRNSQCLKTPLPHPELDGVMELWIVLLDKSNQADSELFEQSIQYALDELSTEKLLSGQGRAVCGWVSSGLSFDQFAENISRMTIQKRPSGGESLLRFYDPAVLNIFITMMDSWQRKRFLNNIDSWSYFNGDGELCTEYGVGSGSRKMDFSLGLTEDNLEDLNNVTHINKILRRFRMVNNNQQYSESQNIQLLLPALRYFVGRFSLQDDGVIEFGLDVLSIRTCFYLDSVVNRHLPSKKHATPSSYLECKSKITESEWELLASAQQK